MPVCSMRSPPRHASVTHWMRSRSLLSESARRASLALAVEAARYALRRRQRIADSEPLEQATAAFIGAAFKAQGDALRRAIARQRPDFTLASAPIDVLWDEASAVVAADFRAGMVEAYALAMLLGAQRAVDGMSAASEAFRPFLAPPPPRGVDGAWNDGQVPLDDMGHAILRGTVFDRDNPRAQDWLIKNSADLVRGVDAETRSQLRNIIYMGRVNGQSSTLIGRNIASRFPEMAEGRPQQHIDSRAHLIATTEMARGYEQGQKQVVGELITAGLPVIKRWLTVGDERVDDQCTTNGGAGEIAFDKSFPSGAPEPPAHPACRCTTLYRVPTRAEQEKLGIPTPIPTPAPTPTPAPSPAPAPAPADPIFSDPAMAARYQTERAAIANQPTETAVVFTSNGRVLRQSAAGDPTLDARTNTGEWSAAFKKDVRGGWVMHNHPDDVPPSFPDVWTMQRDGARGVDVVRGDVTYRVTPGPMGAPDRSIVEKAYTDARFRLIDSYPGEIPEAEKGIPFTARYYETALRDLDQRGYIKYERIQPAQLPAPAPAPVLKPAAAPGPPAPFVQDRFKNLAQAERVTSLQTSTPVRLSMQGSRTQAYTARGVPIPPKALPLHRAQKVSDTLGALHRDFPESYAHLAGVNLSDAVMKRGVLADTSIPWSYGRMEAQSTIRLNVKSFSQGAKFERDLSFEQRTHHFADGSPEGVINHEFGHVMMDRHAAQVRALMRDLESPSIYGDKSEWEKFAELFAEARGPKAYVDLSPGGKVVRKWLNEEAGTGTVPWK